MIIFVNGEKLLTESDLPPQWNLLTNSKGPFQPDQSRIDNHIFPSAMQVYMVNGQTYTVTAQSNGNFIYTHDTSHESNNITIWLTADTTMQKYYQIITDANTSTGTTFTWSGPTGIQVVRLNTYRTDNSIKIWNIKIEKGSRATEWLPAISDLLIKNQNGENN